jgi:hypothetical protein
VGRLKVGLVWAGSATFTGDRLRSPRLGAVLPLLAGDIRFFGLQLGAGRQDLEGRAMPANFEDLGGELGDFAETAAVLHNLDLLVSSCTGIVHLAGALGRPTWVLLPAAADWRWMLGRSDSPWYPSVRLYRQATLGDWSGPVDAVARDLERLSRDRGPGPDAAAKLAAASEG